MDKNKRLLDNLFKIARDNDPVAGGRLAACVVYKNQIIAYGFNQAKTHPFQAQYSKNEESIYWHAETNAIHNALRVLSETELAKCTLYVARARYELNTPNWTWGNSKPCQGCSKCIDKYNIKRVVYTTNETNHYGVITE